MKSLTKCEARALYTRTTLTPRFTDFFTNFEEKKRLFCSLASARLQKENKRVSCTD